MERHDPDRAAPCGRSWPARRPDSLAGPPSRRRDGGEACEPGGAAPRCIASGDLLAGAAEVQIEHQGVRYRLRQTRRGKLILTK